MVYAFIGTDAKKVTDALEKTLGALRMRAPHASILRIDSEKMGETDIDTLLSSQGLFHPASIIVLDDLLEYANYKTAVIDALPEMALSPHVFLIKEQKVHTPELKKLERHAEKIVRHDAQEIKKDAPPFALADALIAKDKKQLWLRLAQALRVGFSPEELHGILFWGAKNLVLAGAPSPEEVGLNPFVYKKARAAREKFSDEDVEQLLAELAVLPHEARKSGMPLELALERFALSFPQMASRTSSA